MRFSKVIEYVLLSYSLFKLLSFAHENLQLMLGKWIKLGRISYRFGIVQVFFIILLFGLLSFYYYCFVKGKLNFELYDYVFLYFIFLFFIHQKTYNFILKNKRIGIVSDNTILNYKCKEIKYIALKTDYLSIALKDEKVFTFSLDTFTKEELLQLNSFFTIENFNQYYN